MRSQLGAIFFFLLVGLAVPFLMLSAGRLLRPRAPGRIKRTVYECGELPLRQAWFNFNPRFYLVALAFLVFDVEVTLTFPVATALRRLVARGLGGPAFVEIALFVAVLALGLAYLWGRGDLDWIRPGPRTERERG